MDTQHDHEPTAQQQVMEELLPSGGFLTQKQLPDDLQHNPGDVDVHRDSPILERRRDEATERQRRHDAEREGEERVGSGHDRVHLWAAAVDAVPPGMM